MSDETKPAVAEPGPPSPRPPWVRRQRTALLAALLAGGVLGAGAAAIAERGSQPVLVALTPAPITAMRDGNVVAVKGQVAEIFGNKFILADDSGRALIDTGPSGDGSRLVAKAEPVIVQGRFADGFVHAMAIQHADGNTVMLAPPGPPGPPPPPGPPRGPLG